MNFADPLYGGVPGDLFYAGPDGEAEAVVEQLIEDVGLRSSHHVKNGLPGGARLATR